jgi:hypothetical protein
LSNVRLTGWDGAISSGDDTDDCGGGGGGGGAAIAAKPADMADGLYFSGGAAGAGGRGAGTGNRSSSSSSSSSSLAARRAGGRTNKADTLRQIQGTLRRHAPEKLPDAGALLDAFGGREAELLRQLQRQYAPRLRSPEYRAASL